jgi:hypothetical protein
MRRWTRARENSGAVRAVLLAVVMTAASVGAISYSWLTAAHSGPAAILPVSGEVGAADVAVGSGGATLSLPAFQPLGLSWSVLLLSATGAPSRLPLTFAGGSYEAASGVVDGLYESGGVTMSQSFAPVPDGDLTDQVAVENIGPRAIVTDIVLGSTVAGATLSALRLAGSPVSQTKGAVAVSAGDYGLAAPGFAVSWFSESSAARGGVIESAGGASQGLVAFGPFALAPGVTQLLQLDVQLALHPASPASSTPTNVVPHSQMPCGCGCIICGGGGCSPNCGTPPVVCCAQVAYNDASIGYTGSSVTKALVGLGLAFSVQVSNMGLTDSGSLQTSDTVFFHVVNAAGSVVASHTQTVSSAGTYTWDWTPTNSSVTAMVGTYGMVAGATDSCATGCGSASTSASSITFYQPAPWSTTSSYYVGHGTRVFAMTLGYQALYGYEQVTSFTTGGQFNLELGTSVQWQPSAVEYKNAQVWPGTPNGGVDQFNETFTPNVLEYSPASSSGLGLLNVNYAYWLDEVASSGTPDLSDITNFVEMNVEAALYALAWAALLADPGTDTPYQTTGMIWSNETANTCDLYNAGPCIIEDTAGNPERTFGVNVWDTQFGNGNGHDYLWVGSYTAWLELNFGPSNGYAGMDFGPTTLTFGIWVETTS